MASSDGMIISVPLSRTTGRDYYHIARRQDHGRVQWPVCCLNSLHLFSSQVPYTIIIKLPAELYSWFVLNFFLELGLLSISSISVCMYTTMISKVEYRKRIKFRGV